MDLRRVETFATRHHGVVTLPAAQRSGVSVASWYRAHDRGQLQRLYPGVSRIVGSQPTALQSITAGVLAAGPDAVASHRTAAALWGIPRPADDPIDVILPRRTRSSRRRKGIVVHRPRDHADLVPADRERIPTTTVVRTLCDLGAVDRPAVPGAVGHALANRLCSPAGLDRAIGRHSGHGRDGVVAVRSALAEWMLDGKPADSVLEIAMQRLFSRYSLPPCEFHAIVCGYEVDFRIRETSIVIECDGWTTHGLDRRTFDRDRERDATLLRHGFVTLRFTYGSVIRRPAATAREILAAVRRWAPHLAA